MTPRLRPATLAIALSSAFLPALTAQVFEPAPKPADLARLANSARAEFGYVSVPENRQKPGSPRRIKLAVIIVKAQAARPQADPVFYFVGGPGGSATRSSSGLPLFEALNADRDIVFADPRGAGFSIPNLATSRGGSTIAAFTRNNFNYLTRQGIDLSAYNTTEIAEDYENVRTALGYGPMNVVASSYGTFVAQEFLRRHPRSLRCLVMSGNSPATDPFLPTTLAINREGLEALFTDVQSDRRARRQYPNLKDRFFRLASELQRNPLRFTSAEAGGTVTISGDDLLSRTTALLQRTETIKLLPLLITQLERGQTNQLVSRFFRPPTGGGNAAFGMYLSVLGTDFRGPNYVPFTIANVNADPRPALRNISGISIIQLAVIVDEWNVPFAPGTTRQLPTSNVKTLLLNGKMDAQTPASGGAAIAANLSESTNYVYPRSGHAVGFFNGPDMDAAIAFITDPTRPPGYSNGNLLRRNFYATRQPARGSRGIDDLDAVLVSPPVKPPSGAPSF